MNAMPRKVLLLGSGALKIGEAGEFDYSGSQAMKALKEEGVSTVLVNPNIATVQTSAALADRIYFLPVTPHFVAQVIERERPDAIALGFGGQTALNCGLALAKQGVLEKYGVAVLGTPIATIEDTEDRALFAAKLGLGYNLGALPNAITGATSACFEPALDYVVVKVPRWDLQKFRGASPNIGSSMKSVGEVMAIGRSFEEALAKALRMIEAGGAGAPLDDIERVLREPTPDRIYAAAEALRRGYSIERLHELTHIDCWFLQRIARMVSIERELRREGSAPLFARAKQAGFSDAQIAELTGLPVSEIKAERRMAGVVPCVKQIDTLAGEYPARTNYLYLTYNAAEDDLPQGELENAVLVLGSGPYRIGSSVEFDWCAVSTVQALRRLGYKTIMLNHNPETVSTDYNECDRLYFDEISLETVLDICRRERPLGVVVSMGGQAPNNLALALAEAGVPLLGTSASAIDTAEDRHKFSRLLDRLGIAQPAWRELVSTDDALGFARSVGYPVMVRPSYVLSGAAMAVAANDAELRRYLGRATTVSPRHPVVISKFLENARELELDGVACRGALVVSAVSEHVENAGVHSGDATLVLPPQRTYLETIRRIRRIGARIAAALEIHGPFNIQFLAKNNDVSVIECNLRASRSFPFVSKVMRVNFIDLAAAVMLGRPVPVQSASATDLEYVGVKAPQFSFTRLDGADPVLGVEMASTGEVGCLGDDFEEAFLKALLSVGFRLPVKSVLLSTGPIADKAAFLESARLLAGMGVRLYATEGTAAFLRDNGIEATVAHWPDKAASPNTLELLAARAVDLVVNIPKHSGEEELSNDYLIRRRAADYGVPLITNIQLANRFVEALAKKRLAELQIKSWQEYGP